MHCNSFQIIQNCIQTEDVSLHLLPNDYFRCVIKYASLVFRTVHLILT